MHRTALICLMRLSFRGALCSDASQVVEHSHDASHRRVYAGVAFLYLGVPRTAMMSWRSVEVTEVSHLDVFELGNDVR
jgi:hypothetical protein